MKYLLIGINGVYNYGCEAIVRGSVNILRAFDPQAEITYATLSPDYDRKMLADCGLEIITRRFISRFSFPRLARRLAACLGIEIPVMFDLKETATEKKYDYVLSIGGDIYTLSPDNKEYPSALMLFGDYCEKNGRHYILWGASVGPFSVNPGVEKKVKEHLLRISGITSREKKSTEYLNSIGLGGRLLECADPAFTVAAEITKETGSFSGAIPEKIVVFIRLLPFVLVKLENIFHSMQQTVPVLRDSSALKHIRCDSKVSSTPERIVDGSPVSSAETKESMSPPSPPP